MSTATKGEYLIIENDCQCCHARGMWYVVYRRYVGKYRPSLYLHQDGTWSTMATTDVVEDGFGVMKLTGYYPSESAAREALDAAIAAGNVPGKERV